MSITLASKRYTIAALGSTLDSRYPGGGAAGFTPEAGFTVSGVYADGGAVTITKAATFGTKPNSAKPLYWMNWGGGGSQNGDTTLGRYSMSTFDADAALQASTKLSRSSYALEYPYNGSASGAIGGPFVLDTDGVTGKFYVFTKMRMNFSADEAYAQSTSWNQKLWRVWSGASGFGTNNTVLALGQNDSANSNGKPRITGEYTDVVGTTYVDGAFGIRKDTWVTDEIEFIDSSGVDISDASIHWTRNGIKTSKSNYISKDTAKPDPYRRLFMPQEELTWALTSWRAWFDCVYVDDSLCRVVVSDSSTWNESTANAREIQIPTAWAAGEVSIVMRQGELSSLSGKYLYVINSSGSAIKIGVFL